MIDALAEVGDRTPIILPCGWILRRVRCFLSALVIMSHLCEKSFCCLAGFELAGRFICLVWAINWFCSFPSLGTCLGYLLARDLALPVRAFRNVSDDPLEEGGADPITSVACVYMNSELSVRIRDLEDRSRG
jgi:hypothetical protein